MSTTPPEVTDRLVEFLYERTAFGDRKYGTPLLPFDGRNTIMDALEEAADLAQYLMKKVMENLTLADLLTGAAQYIRSLGGNPNRAAELDAMAATLRADCERSVPVEAGEDLSVRGSEPEPYCFWPEKCAHCDKEGKS